LKYFLDTEFSEHDRTIELISIGIVAEDGREFYAVNSRFPDIPVNPWVKEHVIPNLFSPVLDAKCRTLGVPLVEMGSIILDWLDMKKHGLPIFWGYFSDYDWVVFCWLFGDMKDIPEGFPMYCRDLKQWADQFGVRLPTKEGIEHHALADARWIKSAHEWLTEYLKNVFTI